jgi:hypothetical protein
MKLYRSHCLTYPDCLPAGGNIMNPDNGNPLPHGQGGDNSGGQIPICRHLPAGNLAKKSLAGMTKKNGLAKI